MAEDDEPQEVEVKFNKTVQFSDFNEAETQKIMKRNAFEQCAIFQQKMESYPVWIWQLT